ncbi:MAG: outer membrane lipoprotein-sorting protein [Chitinophagales bacterium]
MLRTRLPILAAAVIVFATALAFALPASAITPEEILKRVDDNDYLKSARIKASMTITSGGRDVTKTYAGYIDGDRAMIEFTNARDRGTKYLKLNGELWMFFPDAEDVVKISGHLLRQGMMGSDFSYEDALESQKLTTLYQVKLVGEEKVDDRDTYVLELVARPGAEVAYAKRKQWITKTEFVPVKAELYAQSGKLLKVVTAGNIKRFGDRWFATEVVMENMLKKGSRTRMTVDSLEFGVTIPPETFSREALRR